MGKDPFKGRNAVTAQKGGVTTSTYAITGKTLAEVYAAIQSKGPAVDGRRYAGATRCLLDGIEEGYEYASEGEDGDYTGYARFHKAKLKFKCQITLPKFADYKSKLSPEDQRTWEAFYTGVVAHEAEHVADFEAEVGRWAAEVAALRGEGKGKDEKRAQAAAKAALGKLFTAAFTPAENEKRLKASAKKLDAATGHGPTLVFTK